MKKRLMLTIATLVLGSVASQAIVLNINSMSNTDRESPGSANNGWVSTDGNITENEDAVFDVSTFIVDDTAPPQTLAYTVTGLDIDGIGGANDRVVINFSVSSHGQNLQTIWDGTLSEPKNAGWLSAGGTTLNANGEFVQFDFVSASVDVNGEVGNGSYSFDGFTAATIGSFTTGTEIALVNGNLLTNTVSRTIDLTPGGLDANLHVLRDNTQGTAGAYRPEAWSFQLTVEGPELNTFTGGAADGGLWATAGNWSIAVPSASENAVINSNLTADLDGATGNAERLLIGSNAGQSGGVTNGALVVTTQVSLGVEEGSAGTVDVTSFTGGSAAENLAIATADDANGSLTAGTGTITAADVRMATGSNSVGTLSITSGTVTAGGAVNIATGQDASATVAAGTSFVLASTNGLHVGTGIGATHDLTAANFTITEPIGDFSVGAGTGSSIKSLIGGTSSIGTVTANTALDLTAGHHEITEIDIADQAGSTGSLSSSGSATVNLSGNIDIAWGNSASGSLDLGSLVSGVHTAGVVNVARGDLSTGSLTYTAGDLHLTGAMEVGTGGDYASGTVELQSLSGGGTLSIAQSTASLSSVGTTGTVTVAESALVGIVRIARAEDSVGTLIVGDTLDVGGAFLNAAGFSSNAVGVVSADTIIKTNNVGGGTGIQIAFEQNCDGRITANDGELYASSLTVAAGQDSYGIFAITNGTLELTRDEILSIAAGENSTGHVLVALTSSGTNDVSIGMGAGSTGSLTMTGGALTTANLQIGDAGYIDITGDTTTITWLGGDFEALWNDGKLRNDGVTGPGNPFSNYFSVSGDTLTSTPAIGAITIAPGPGVDEVTISWEGLSGQTYKVMYKTSLVSPTWTEYSSVPGVDGPMSETVPSTDPATFYQVTY